ncbi:MAG: hypothetical protein PWP35_602 [Bacteroidales bacterium]|nr:hypothetical protein [Bacteroidales bacterium]
MAEQNPWDIRFATEDYYYGKEPNVYLSEKLRKYHPGLVLLPGEGEGRNAVFAASLGCDVYAFDQSRVAQEKALKLARKHALRIDYRLTDVLEAHYPKNYFHMVGLIYLHLPPHMRQEAHARLQQFLAPEGYLVLEAFHKQHLGSPFGPKDPEMLYDEETLQQDFKNLEIIEIYTADVELAEGHGHKGKAKVVRLTAQKKTVKT